MYITTKDREGVDPMEEEGSSGFEEGGVPETATSDRQAEAPLGQGGSANQDNVNDDTKERSSQMKFGKITLILGLVVAVVAVFAEIPYVAVALAVLGLIVGITDDSDQGHSVSHCFSIDGCSWSSE